MRRELPGYLETIPRWVLGQAPGRRGSRIHADLRLPYDLAGSYSTGGPVVEWLRRPVPAQEACIRLEIAGTAHKLGGIMYQLLTMRQV